MRNAITSFGNDDLINQIATMEARRNGQAQHSPVATPVASVQQPNPTPPQKLSLRDLLRTTVLDKSVQSVRAEMDQAQEFDPQTIADYVQLRWEINALPGMADGWSGISWEDQLKSLANLAKKNSGIRMMISTVEQLHQNAFLRATLDEVMKHIGTPLQTVETMQQFKLFLNQSDVIEQSENARFPGDGITMPADLGDPTDHNMVTYSPQRGSKVAKDGWLVIKRKHEELAEGWREIEKLRNLATPQLTPFKVSDKTDRFGLTGNLFVMSRTGHWAVLLRVMVDPDNVKRAKIAGHVGLEESQLPAPNQVQWDNRRHGLMNPEESDILTLINEVLEELNSRQHNRAMDEKAKSDEEFKSLKDQATIPPEPKHEGLNKILCGEEGKLAICFRYFSVYKKENDKTKNGHFGIVITGENGILVLVDVVSSDCFCFDRSIVGKKIPIGIEQCERRVRGAMVKGERVRLNIKDFAIENGIRARLSDQARTSLFMVTRILEKRLNQEAVFSDADDEYEDDQVDVEEAEANENGSETVADLANDTQS